MIINDPPLNNFIMGSPRETVLLAVPLWQLYGEIYFIDQERILIMKENSKSIKIIVTDVEDYQISTQAQNCGLSKNAYIKQMALFGQIINSMSEAKIRSILAELYNLAEQIDDFTISKKLKAGADQIWLYLK